MKNNLFVIITGFIILVLASICLITFSTKPTYSILTYEKFTGIESGIVYFGSMDSDVKQELKRIDQSFTIKEYTVKEFDLETLNKYLKENNLKEIEEQGYVFVYNNVPVWSGNKSFDKDELNEEINYRQNGVLKTTDIVYKVPEKVTDLIELINSKKYTVTVLSKSGCSYCTLFQPVVNNIAKNYNVDIYYLDKTKYTEEDYNKFRNLELDIKASCTTNDISTTTKTFASYPLLLITKNGKSVDCLLGYQSESDVIELLSKYNIIK